MGRLHSAAGILARHFQGSKYFFVPYLRGITISDIRVKQPVFLLGVQNGGLTIISRMLHRYRDAVYCMGNTDFWAGRDELHNVRYRQLPESMRLGTKEQNVLSRGKFGFTTDWTYATDDLFSEFRETAQTLSDKDAAKFRRVIQRCIAAYALPGRADKARFIDKSQTYSLKVPAIKSVFPDAKFVLITRNPYAICYKVAKKYSYDAWESPPDLEGRFEHAAQHWKNTFKTAMMDFSKEDVGIIVRLEDFLQNPKENLKRILTYINVDDVDAQELLPKADHHFPLGSSDESKWHPLKEEVNSKYLQHLSSHHAEIIKRVVGNTAEKLGYTWDAVKSE